MSITIALPSKGRLREDALAIFTAAGLPVIPPRDARTYRTRIEGRDDVEIAFLSASEISGELGAGSIDMGITGEDLLRENIADCEERIEIAARLGFGHADVVVAAPDSWLDVETMADLDDVAADFSPAPTRGACVSPPNTGGRPSNSFRRNTVFRFIALLKASALLRARLPPVRRM